jgi:hypothetical protein
MATTLDSVRSQDSAYLRTVISAASAQLEAAPPIQLGDTWGFLLEVKESGRIFRLNAPLVVSRSAENGYVCLEHKDLSILSFGCSEAEAVRAFCEDFGALWDGIAQAPNSTLTREARAVKARFIRVVNTVVPE